MDEVCRRARPLLGTVVSIEVSGGASSRQLTAAIDAAFEAVVRVQRCMSFHDAASDLSALNRAAVGEVASVDPWLAEVVQSAKELCDISAGHFDPGVAPVLVRQGVLPPCATAEEIGRSTVQNLRVYDSGSVVKIGPAVIDLGGIAKGFAVDMAVRALQELGVEEGIVNAGGDLRVFGPTSHAVTLRHPFSPGVVSEPFELRNLACCSSVSEPQGPTCIDPLLQAPLPCKAAVTVVAAEALWADALTKLALLQDGYLAPEVLERYSAAVLWSFGAGPEAGQELVA